MRADARKRCRFAPKNAFIPRTGAGITPSNVPRTTTKAKKERKAVRVQRYYFLRRKRAADDMSRRVTSIKKRRANAILKKAYLYRAENMKKLQKFCVKIVSLPYFY